MYVKNYIGSSSFRISESWIYVFIKFYYKIFVDTKKAAVYSLLVFSSRQFGILIVFFLRNKIFRQH